jgi:ribosomal protein L9
VEIKNLETSLADTRRRCDELVRDAERKWKTERKDREQERERLREEKEQLEEDVRAKENQWRLKEKLYLSVKEKDGVEIDRLNCLVTEL